MLSLRTFASAQCASISHTLPFSHLVFRIFWIATRIYLRFRCEAVPDEKRSIAAIASHASDLAKPPVLPSVEGLGQGEVAT